MEIIGIYALASWELSNHGLLTSLNLRSTKSSIDHEVLTALAHVQMLMIIVTTTQLY